MKKVRIGMIGYKSMGKAHSHAYYDLPFYFKLDTEPVLQTIVGRNELEVKLASEKLGWHSYDTNWRRLLDRDDIDVIDISTPTAAHAEIAIAAAEAGKHILCEIPLAMNADEALKMWKAVKKAGVVHRIAHHYRFVPAIQYSKKLIMEGVLGDILHFRANFLQDSMMGSQPPFMWRLRKDMSHFIDLARYLVGEFEEITGMMNNSMKPRPLGEKAGRLSSPMSGSERYEAVAIDAVAALARFENGALGVFEVSCFAKGNRNDNWIEINGSKGSLRWNMESMNSFQLYLEDDPACGQGFRIINCIEDVHPDTVKHRPADHPRGYEQTYIPMMAEFMKGISTDTSPSPNFEDGYRNQLVMDAIEKSASLGEWMKIHH